MGQGRRIARWGASALARTTGTLAALGLAALGVSALAAGGVGPVSVGIVLLVAAAVAWLVVRGSIDLYADRLVLGGVLRRRRTVLLADVVAVEQGRTCLYFRTGADGRVAGPVAVGDRRPPVPGGRFQQRGARIAAAIMAQVNAAREQAGR